MNVKNIFAVLAAVGILCTACACQNGGDKDKYSEINTETSQTSISQTSETSEASNETSETNPVDEETKKYGFNGVVLAVKDGKTLYSGSFNNKDDGFVSKRVPMKLSQELFYYSKTATQYVKLLALHIA